MEKLNREEILCLIRKMGGVTIRLRNTSIHVVVTYQKYVNFLIELSIDDLKYIAGNYIRSIANLFDYEGVIEYDFAFDSIIIAAKATILKNSYIESAVIDETDTLIDDRWIEDNDNYDDDYPHSEYDEIDREIDEEEERKRKEMEDLDERYAEEYNNEYDDTYDDFHCDDDYPCVDYDEEQAQYSSENTTEDDLVDSLNNDLDDYLSKE